MRSAILPLIIGLAACSDATKPKDQPNLVAATYSQSTIDGQQVPRTTPADTCELVNMGGWLSLTAEGAYSMVLDRTSYVCNGVPSGTNYVGQRGTYQLADTAVTFLPTPPYGPAFKATFDPGDYQPGKGGRLRSLRFSFVGHDYWMIEEAPALGSRR